MLTIVIQAGGLSSRMGEDKALKPFLGQPMILRLVQRLSGIADQLLITTNHPENYVFLPYPLIPDLLPGSGPLGGLYTALHAAEQPFVAVIACDMPFVRPDLIQAQRALLEREGVDVVIPRSPDGLEPLHAVYRRDTCIPAIQAALEAGERKMIAWFPAVRVRVMEMAELTRFDPDFHSFINVNSPEEFQQAEALARSMAES